MQPRSLSTSEPWPDGRTALLVYSALDRLVTNCGEHQPWVVLPATALADIDRQAWRLLRSSAI
ncbi:SAV_915 family protein [Flindersiella endophytica]